MALKPLLQRPLARQSPPTGGPAAKSSLTKLLDEGCSQPLASKTSAIDSLARFPLQLLTPSFRMFFQS